MEINTHVWVDAEGNYLTIKQPTGFGTEVIYDFTKDIEKATTGSYITRDIKCKVTRKLYIRNVVVTRTVKRV